MQTNRSTARILCIEDNPGDFFLVKEYLEEKFSPERIIHAADFRTARKLLEDPGNKFDVILLDLKLPDMSGSELIDSILKVGNNVPVIALTGNDNLEFSIRSISSGVSDYLLKDQLNGESLYKGIMFSIERRKNLMKLKESEDRFERLFNDSPQPIWVYDPSDFKNFMVNKVALDLLGYAETEFLSMSVFDMVHPIEREEVKEKILALDPARKATQTGVVYKMITRAGEMIQCDLFTAPLILNGHLYRSVIAIDITEKLAYENKLTKAIIKTQEDERYEIGSELHDNVCQLLAAVQMFIGVLKPSVREEGLGMLQKVTDNTGVAIQEIRNLSHRLAPAFFNDSTLEDAIDRLIGDFSMNKDTEINVKFSREVRDMELNRELILNLYRILQEQMRNIQKYAKASKIDLAVKFKDEDLLMSIKDNGVGFDTAATRTGIGLANMKRRAELFGGTARVHSSPGHGCSLEVKIPMRS